MGRSRTTILSIVAATMLAASLALVGCSGGSSNSSSSEEIATSAFFCYVPVEIKSDVMSQTMSLDDRGAVVESTTKMQPSGDKVTSNEVDDFGLAQTVVTTFQGSDMNSNYSYEGMTDNGLFSKMTVSDDNGQEASTSEYTWYGENTDTPTVKSVVTASEVVISTNKYDEDGYLISSEIMPASNESPAYPSSYTYTYTKGDDGNITGVTVKGGVQGADTTQEYTCECDDNGNIVKFIDSDGKVAKTIKYKLVNDPYAFVYAVRNSDVSPA